MRRRGNSDREARQGELLRTSEKAYLFRTLSSENVLVSVWLPKSQCDWSPNEPGADPDDPGQGWMLIPEWLIREKELA